MSVAPELVAALLLGLLGSVHCVGMCGGLAGALAFALGPRCGALRRHLLLLAMGAGRVGSYAVAGALAGALLPAGPEGPLPFLRAAAGVLLVLMGIAIAGWGQATAWIERAGQRAWQRIAGRRFAAARIDGPGGALLAGAVWGWLPCGLVYSTLAWSASAGSALQGAQLMAAFGIGTVPAVLGTGLLAERLRGILQRRGSRLLAGVLVAGFGIWTVAAAGGGHVHHHH